MYERYYKSYFELVVRHSGNRCWGWTGKLDHQGYAVLAGVKAARIAWEMIRGTIPAGVCVLHRCDNRRCTNNKHLWLGSRGDNNQDRATKGRNRFNWRTLTVQDVVTIRRLYSLSRAHGTQARLARRFRVSNTTIWQIVTRKSYKYV